MKTYYFKGPAIDGAALSEHHCEKMEIVADKNINHQMFDLIISEGIQKQLWSKYLNDVYIFLR